MLIKNKISKEDFKRAMVDCWKYAWVFYNFKNFEYALKMQNSNKELLFKYINKPIETIADYDTNASSIDLEELLKELIHNNADLSKEERTNLIKEFNDFYDPDEFTNEKYPGDAIVDGNEVGLKAVEYFEQKVILQNQKTKNRWFNCWS